MQINDHTFDLHMNAIVNTIDDLQKKFLMANAAIDPFTLKDF